MAQMDSQDNLDELVQMVFSRPAQAPKTIQLQLDENTAIPSVIPEIFAEIATRGARRLFGVTNVMELTEQQIGSLEKYMQSMGVVMQITCNFGRLSPFEVLAAGGTVENVQVSFQWL